MCQHLQQTRPLDPVPNPLDTERRGRNWRLHSHSIVLVREVDS